MEENSEYYEDQIIIQESDIEKIKGLELTLKAPKSDIFSQFGKIFQRPSHVIHNYYECEKSVLIEESHGKTKISTLNNSLIRNTLEKVKPEVRRKIKYVYLAGIEILLKANFREGINCPVLLAIQDERFTNPDEGNLGIIEGNLKYQKMKFRCYPKYAISLKDENLYDALNLHYEVKNKNLLKKGNHLFSVHYRSVFTFTNTNFGNLYSNEPFVKIDEFCNDLCKIAEPKDINEKLPQFSSLSITEAKEIGTSSLVERSYSIRRDGKIQLPENKNINIISKKNPHLNNFKIEGFYFKNNMWNKTNILIDTGAGQNFCGRNFSSNIKSMSNHYDYKNFTGDLISCKEETIIQVKINEIEFSIHCIISPEDNEIILGMSFLFCLQPH